MKASAVIIVMAALASLGAGAPPTADTPPAAAPVAPPAADSPPVAAPAARPPFTEVGALLDAVEAVSQTLHEFRAAITMETADEITGDTERRLGQVVFMQEAGVPKTRRFALLFDKFIDGTGRMDEKPVRYIYADGWLVEADFTQRTLIRRQLARPGEPYDPLKPGEGPVPLPIGQRKADVLQRFEATLEDAAPTGILAKLTGVQGVRLKPRPGMADRDLVEAVVWYDLATLAPMGVQARKKNGMTTVLLRNPQINAGLDDAQRALFTLPVTTTDGWRVDERPLPAPSGAPS